MNGLQFDIKALKFLKWALICRQKVQVTSNGINKYRLQKKILTPNIVFLPLKKHIGRVFGLILFRVEHTMNAILCLLSSIYQPTVLYVENVT